MFIRVRCLTAPPILSTGFANRGRTPRLTPLTHQTFSEKFDTPAGNRTRASRFPVQRADHYTTVPRWILRHNPSLPTIRGGANTLPSPLGKPRARIMFIPKVHHRAFPPHRASDETTNPFFRHDSHFTRVRGQGLLSLAVCLSE